MKRTIVIVAVLLVGATVAVLARERFRAPKNAVAEFIDARDRAEDQLADPLIRTGCGAAPAVLSRIADPSMPRRRYAIGYLGNRRCSIALEALEAIASDEAEETYFRADALEAIAQIHPEKAAAVARRHAARGDFLGERARAVLRGEDVGLHRTYWQAMRGVHE